jgi:CheY-like chemotaxis protein
MPPAILAVDDDDDVLQLLDVILSAQGYEVRRADNGRAALDALGRSMPSLILLDLRMPVMSGLEFARELRSRHQAPLPPIVVVTAAADPERQAAEVGAAAWVAKPFDVPRLVEVVARALEGRA